MTVRTMLVSCALLSSYGILPGPAAARADEQPKAAPATVDLSGRWIYNAELSDDARQKMHEAMERGGGRGGGRPPMGPGGPGGGMRGGPGGRMGPPPGGMEGADDRRAAMRAIFEPAEELAINQSGTEIEIDEKLGRMRRLHPDGRKYKTDNGASEIKTSWKEGTLLVETKHARGGGLLETWELVPDGSRVIVNVKMEGGFGPGVELKRVYDRAGESAAR